MDPDTALAALRAALVAHHDAEAGGDEAALVAAAADLADYAGALDEWLTAGGFLPTEWSAHR